MDDMDNFKKEYPNLAKIDPDDMDVDALYELLKQPIKIETEEINGKDVFKKP